MARRAPSLGPKPSLFFFCFLCLFVLFFLLGGGCFLLPFFASEWQKTVFPLKKGHFLFIFECLPLFLLSLFWPSTCSISLSLSLSLSIYIYISLSLSLVLFFLPSCLYFVCFLLAPSFSLCLSFSVFFAFVSWKLTTSKDSIAKFFFHQSCVFFWFPVLFSLSNPFVLSLFFLVFNYAFCSTSMFFGFKKHKLKNTNFWSKGELQQNIVFLITCVLQNVKIYRFFAPFLAKFWLMFKKH